MKATEPVFICLLKKIHSLFFFHNCWMKLSEHLWDKNEMCLGCPPWERMAVGNSFGKLEMHLDMAKVYKQWQQTVWTKASGPFIQMQSIQLFFLFSVRKMLTIYSVTSKCRRSTLEGATVDSRSRKRFAAVPLLYPNLLILSYVTYKAAQTSFSRQRRDKMR